MPLLPRQAKEFHPWEYFVNAAKYLHGLDRLHVTGGEPTLHPKFTEFAPGLRDLFGCKQLTMETNGYGFKRFPETFKLFDEVYASVYTPETYPGCPDNREQIAYIEKYLAGSATKFMTGLINFIPRSRRGTKMCHRGRSNDVTYARGLLFPCCVSSGILEVDHGIPLTENWREEIVKVDIPCEHCWFAEA